MSYTRAPWREVLVSDGAYVVDRNNFSVIEISNCQINEEYESLGYQHWSDSKDVHRWVPIHEQHANAKLIAAAPELLEALEDLMALESRDRVMPAGLEWDAARAAIAKAKS